MTPELAPETIAQLDPFNQLGKLVALRDSLTAERAAADSPAVARALEMADYYLFMGMTYLGYVDRLYPEQA